MVDGVAAEPNDELKSAVAIPDLIVKPSSFVPAGICERNPAEYSAADGPASTPLIAARPILTVAGTVRSETNSLPCRVNQACRLTWRAGLWAGVAAGTDAGVWGPAVGWAVPGGWLGADAVELAGALGLAEPVGAWPSTPDWLVPQAASKPTLMIRMGRRFMMGLLMFMALTPPQCCD